MKKRSILPILFALALTGCDLISLDGFGGLSNLFNKPETQNNQNNNTGNTTQNSGNNSSGQTTGGGSTTGGDSGTGNTGSQYTEAWTGIEYDIAYSWFKGNLPRLKKFNGYFIGNYDNLYPYFNPYIKGWSNEYQTYYDGALRDIGYSYEGEEFDEDLETNKKVYKKGTYNVTTAHYRGTDGEWYLDVYAWNSKNPSFETSFEIKQSISIANFNPKSGYKSFSKTVGNYIINCSSVCKNSEAIQLNENSTMTIQGEMTHMNIWFNENPQSCLVYAGTSANNLKIVYNDAGEFTFPSGTNYVKIQTLDKYTNIEDISIG